MARGTDSLLGIIASLAVFGLFFGGVVLYKSCAPQSAMRSRIGGKATKLEKPKDCKRVINMGKTRSCKYIVYETYDGDIKMKEYSDWGILEGEYYVPGGAGHSE